ncbi:MAG: molybdate transporter family protein, partial [Halarsenatibacteraceae bacterium]
YRFGARTGGSNIISGIILLIIAFFFASPQIIEIIPYGVLGAMLFFTAFQMYQSAILTEKKGFMLITGILAFITNIAIAFIVTFVIYKGLKKLNIY